MLLSLHRRATFEDVIGSGERILDVVTSGDPSVVGLME